MINSLRYAKSTLKNLHLQDRALYDLETMNNSKFIQDIDLLKTNLFGGGPNFPTDTLLLHVDAQNNDGFTTTTFEGTTIVDTVKDLSLHVAAPHTSTFVGKDVDTNPPTLATKMTLTTLNGHRAFHGIVRFGRNNWSGGYFVQPSNDYRDVMEVNSDKSYSIFKVFSTEGLGSWANLFNYIRGNGNQGLGIVVVGGNNYFTIAISSTLASGATPTPLRFPATVQFTSTPSYSQVVLAMSARVHRTSVVTNVDGSMVYNYDFHMKIFKISDPTTPVVYDEVVSLPVNVPATVASRSLIYQYDGGHVYLGGDELMYTNYGVQPVNYKVGECLFYNSFIPDNISDNIMQYLVNKWRDNRFVVSGSVSTNPGTSYTLVNSPSTLSDMVYKQQLTNGDWIHSSSAFFTNRNAINLVDNIIGNWVNAWHGQGWTLTMYAIYEFADGVEKEVSSMDFTQGPSSGHFAGVINIYHWNGTEFVEVNYTNDNQFISMIYNETINISFNPVTSNQFKIKVNKHANNTSAYVALAEWTLKN